MRIEALGRRRRPISLTSLIDVIFLLLLFFMLSSTFTRFASVEVTGGSAVASASAERPDVLIRLTGEAWSINGIEIDADAAMTELLRLKEAGAKTAVLMVRGETNSQTLVTAIERVTRGTGLTLSVAR